MKKILLFCDPGIDDAIAIMYCLLHPGLDLVGLVTSYGNVTEKQATDNAAYLLSLAGRQDIPVIRGAKGPFSGEIATYYPEIHGSEGLGPIKTPQDFNPTVYPFQKALDLILKHGNELTIVDVGRSTSLAMAFLLLGAETMNKVEQIFIMGGAFLHPGNVTAVAEANFHGDSIATDLVLGQGRNVTIIPLNITNKAIITSEIIDRIIIKANNPFKALLKPTIEYYSDAYKKLIPGIQGSPLHDVVTLYAVVAPNQFNYIERRVRVEIWQSRGMAIADFRGTPKEEPPETIDKVAFDFNYEAFKEDFIKIMMNPIYYRRN
ncbi:nucleoside hydrolase [Peribacillus alkalitolerans]|uniref:nucleoside hydrolase n=1 Tax=Peribacillus alkalitolerans TaxID=1550385 RepID=UPI0013D58A7D|nr:nucleoside hydrolase [Peribacillus alkalitolerans]